MGFRAWQGSTKIFPRQMSWQVLEGFGAFAEEGLQCCGVFRVSDSRKLVFGLRMSAVPFLDAVNVFQVPAWYLLPVLVGSPD